MKNLGIILCFGEVLVDFIAKGTPRSLSEASVFEKYPGGAPANTAFALGRLNADVAMLASVGRDSFGEFLKKELDSYGVNTKYLQFLKDKPTAVVFVSLDSQKIPHFHSFGEGVAYNYFRSDKKVLDLVGKSGIVHLSSIPFIEEPYRTEAGRILEATRKYGTLVSFDPNIRLHLFKSERTAKKLIKGVFPYAHILKFGEDEFEFLFDGVRKEKACEKLAKTGVKLVLVTEGEKGSSYYFKGAMNRINSFSVKTLDTTGAGDAYIAGILSKIPEHGDLEEISIREMREIVRFGSAVAAISTTKRGAVSALPSLDQVKRFLARRAGS